MPRFVALAAVPPLLVLLDVRRRAAARRSERLLRAQEQWAEAMDRAHSHAA